MTEEGRGIPGGAMAGGRPGERRKAWAAVIGFGFLIMAYYVLKPIRESLAIELGSQNIPALNILSMLSLVGGNALYTWIVGRFPPERFIPGITWFFVVCLVAFWGAFQVLPLQHREGVGGEGVTEPTDTRSEVGRGRQGWRSSADRIPVQGERRDGVWLAAPGELSVPAGGEPMATAASAPTAACDAPGGVESVRLTREGRTAETAGAGTTAGPAIPGGERRMTWVGVVMIASYFVWVNLFALYSISMFWSYLNDVFTTAQGKRLYGLIGYGGLVGGLAGGLLTTWLAAAVGTTHLLLVAAALLVPTAWLPVWLLRVGGADSDDSGDDSGDMIRNSSNFVSCPRNRNPRNPESPESPQSRNRNPEPRPWDGLTCTLGSSLLFLLALETFCYTFASSLFSYQVNALVEETLPSRDLRTVYWANLYNAINGVSLLTQFTLTWGFMRLTVPVWGLLVLPLSQILGSLWLSAEASLAVAASVVVFRYAANYSTGRALRELMYTLVTREEKYQGKGFIDTLVFRAGDGLASGFLLWGLHGYGPGGWIDATIVGVMAVSAGAIVALAVRFKASLGGSTAG